MKSESDRLKPVLLELTEFATNVFRSTIRGKLPCKWSTVPACALLAILTAVLLREGRIGAQDFPSVIGRIEGDDLEVVTTTPGGVEKNAAPTAVASGSDVTLRSGHALLMLDAGGEVSVCGPAHFKVIKSSGAVTLALDYGRVHPSLESADTFTIYTPTIVATPIAISGGLRDMTLGLDPTGEMCVLTARGAMRVEPQFSEQSVLVPQGGRVSLVGGQIQSLQIDTAACSCEFPRASLERQKAAPPEMPTAPPIRTVSVLNHPLPPERKDVAESPAPSAPKEGPIYTVLMPPLIFNASAPEPPPSPDPDTILLVREVRLHPTVVFRGHVNPAPTQAAVLPPAQPAPSKREGDQPPQSQPGFFDRMRNFFRKLAGHGGCAGAGCSS